MTKTRLDGLWLLLLGGCVVPMMLSLMVASPSPAVMQDFRVVYFPARCLIQHCDPYNESEVLHNYRAEGPERPTESATDRLIVTRYIYPPTAFFLTVPFAMLPWGHAHLLWMLLTVGAMVVASLLAWDVAADYGSILAGAMIGYMLANSEVLLVLGNPSGLVISLSVVAAWCFLRERLIPVGVVCLAIGLAVKPQDAGFVWLYFLLAGGAYRRRALYTLLATVALSLPGIVWAFRASPHWMQELHANILAFSVHGGITDPGPASTGTHGAGTMINLQTALSYVRDDPHFYNLATCLIVAPLLLVWAWVTVRTHWSRAGAWLALAVVAPLTMLPVYHHLYDTKLLLLTIPACSLLWSEGGWIARVAIVLNAVGFVLTGDISWTMICTLIEKLHLPGGVWTAGAIEAIPVPLLMLAMSVFYLWVYARHCPVRSEASAVS